MSTDRIAGFDRELTLGELVRPAERERLAAALAALIGPTVRLTDSHGAEILARGEGRGGDPVALVGELESIGFLSASADTAQVAAAAQLLHMLLRAHARFLMASELHLETVQEDYEELQRKHAALQASEARYRELAEQLEQRVAEQVKTIEAAQRQLYQSEKLASVGQLAAGVAHEINNPIGFIASNISTAQGYVQRLSAFAGRLRAATAAVELQQAWGADDLDFVLQDFAALLAESSEGAARVARIVTDLKGFSRVDQVGAEEADINAVIRQVCNVAAGQVRGRAKVTLQLGTLPRLRCNSAQLGQVFLNLLLNAVDAVTAAGEIRFESDVAEDSIRVRVSDNGRGIAAELLPRIFDPFFTTKAVGSGTGLGLTVSNDIVKAHGGRIEVDSSVGKGSTFTVWLPIK
jgi:two-component system NtrC family sensor kinase